MKTTREQRTCGSGILAANAEVKFAAIHWLCVVLLSLLAPFAFAQSGARGGPFFLLSDASYSPDETAMVRLEAQDMGAIADYGGADVYVYRVQRPLEFFEGQKKLYRIDVACDFEGPRLSEDLAPLLGDRRGGSRSAWRAVFSPSSPPAGAAQ